MSDLNGGCAAVEELAPEIALGILSGSERATAVAHLSSCPSCRRLVEELTASADSLLGLAPEAEPSIGFESRVLAATAAATQAGERPAAPVATAVAVARPPKRRRSRGFKTAVAAVAAVAAALVGLAVGMAASNGPADPVRTALAVTANGKSTCRVWAYGDQQAWVFLSLDAPREWSADYTVEVTTAAGGTAATLGHFKLQDGNASFAAQVDVPASHLRAVRVLDASGALRYEAGFN